MNVRRWLWVGFPGMLGLLALAACSPNTPSGATPTSGTGTSGPAIPTMVSTSTVAPPTVVLPTATPVVGVCPPNPSPALPSQAVVSSPVANAPVQSPLTVTGMVEAFEAQFEADLLDAAGNQLAKVHGMAQQGQQLSPFTVTLSFSVNVPTPGCLRIYQVSAADGSLVKFVQVPVVAVP